MIKGSILSEDTTILNVYALNNEMSNYMSAMSEYRIGLIFEN